MHFDPSQIKHLPNSIGRPLIKKLLEDAKSVESTPATVGRVVDNKYVAVHDSKICTANFVDYSSFSGVVKTLTLECKNLVEQHYDVKCKSYSIDFLHYPEGTHYWPHVDGQYVAGTNIKRSEVNRDITCVTYLNDDYEGGEIYFPFFEIEKKPKAGDILMYPGSWKYLHGVKPVKGTRYAIVAWFHTSPEMFQDEIINNTHILKTLNRTF